MNAFLKKLHPVAVLGLLTTLVGIVSDPAVMGFIPHPWSLRIAFLGAVIQATTRAVHKGDVKEIPKGAPAP